MRWASAATKTSLAIGGVIVPGLAIEKGDTAMAKIGQELRGGKERAFIVDIKKAIRARRLGAAMDDEGHAERCQQAGAGIFDERARHESWHRRGRF